MEGVKNMSKNTNTYIKCSRCELNYIIKKDKYCPVCKKEMQALSTDFASGNDPELGLCPICKVNYITEEETVCGTCISESDMTEDELDALYGGVVVEGSDDAKEDDIDDEDGLEMISLGDMEEGDDELDEDDEEQTIDPLDDFDDSLEEVDEEDEDDEDDDYDKIMD